MVEEVAVATNTPKRANVFLLGADPEFCVLQPDGLAFWNLSSRYDTRASIEIGHDSGRLVELRPKPAGTAYELVAHIRGLLEHKALDAIREHKWRAGATSQYPYEGGAIIRTLTMGGHIHFEAKYWPYKDTNDPSIYGGIRRGYPASLPLDRLTALLEHLDILPRTESQQRSTCSSYGSAGDSVRPSAQSWEYRRMCSWLFHPRVAFVVLSLAKLCLVDIEFCKDALYQQTSFDALKRIAETFASKDDDARRLHETIFSLGLSKLQIDHTIDFKDRWKKWVPRGV